MMESPIAVIDLGTNTFNLLIAEFERNKIKALFQEKYPVKLGQQGIHKKIITEEAFHRGIKQILKIHQEIKKHGVTRVEAFATSAIRDASNGKEFVKQVFSKTGISIKIINGLKEAEYIYKGVRAGLRLRASNSLIMDIGGGSTEFIICSADGILWKRSFKLGAARLLEIFKPEDPITQNQCDEIFAYLKKSLKPLYIAFSENGFSELIGSSGSFDTFAEIIYLRAHNRHFPKSKTNYVFPQKNLKKILDEMMEKNRRQRSDTPGMLEMRADMIGIAALFTKFILKEFEIRRCRLSTYSLKEGVLQSIITEK